MSGRFSVGGLLLLLLRVLLLLRCTLVYLQFFVGRWGLVTQGSGRVWGATRRVLLESWGWVVALGEVPGNRVRLSGCWIPNREAGAGGWGDMVLFPHVCGPRGALGRGFCDGILGLVVHLSSLGGLGDPGLVVLGQVRHGGGRRVLRRGVPFLVAGGRGGWREVWGWGLGVGLQRVGVLEG